MPKAKPSVKRPPIKAAKVPPKAVTRIPDETPAEKRKRLAEEKRMKARK